MESIMQQVLDHVKGKALYFVFLAGAVSTYFLYVPAYKKEIEESKLALTKTLNAFTSLNETLKSELDKNSKLSLERTNLLLQNQQLLTDLDNSTEKCTLECNTQLSICNKKIEKTKLDCIRRRPKK